MLIIDRFEGDLAIVETAAGMAAIPKADIPANAREGDVLSIQLDGDATSNRKKNIDKMMNNLFKDS
jgi:hypothetical protein